jgi:membrane associated rhomboid family serine protease
MLAMFFPENDGFQLWQPIAYVYARWVYAHLFNMFALYSFGSALEVLGSKSFILLYFLWFRRRIDAYRN